MHEEERCLRRIINEHSVRRVVGRAEVAGVSRVREDGEPREALSVARDTETQNRQSFVPEREQRDERVVWIHRVRRDGGEVNVKRSSKGCAEAGNVDNGERAERPPWRRGRRRALHKPAAEVAARALLADEVGAREEVIRRSKFRERETSVELAIWCELRSLFDAARVRAAKRRRAPQVLRKLRSPRRERRGLPRGRVEPGQRLVGPRVDAVADACVEKAIGGDFSAQPRSSRRTNGLNYISVDAA